MRTAIWRFLEVSQHNVAQATLFFKKIKKWIVTEELRLGERRSYLRQPHSTVLKAILRRVGVQGWEVFCISAPRTCYSRHGSQSLVRLPTNYGYTVMLHDFALCEFLWRLYSCELNGEIGLYSTIAPNTKFAHPPLAAPFQNKQLIRFAQRCWRR